MGYIAPITNYQYIQYNQRVMDENRKIDPMHVNAVHKADNHSKFHKTLMEMGAVAERVGKKNRRQNEQYQQPIVHPKLFSRMTGKGKHVDDLA